MSRGASSGGSSRPVEPEVSRRPMGSELSNAGIIDMKEFPVVESLPCFDKGKVCMYVCMVITYSRVWINRVRLPILLVVS